MAPSSETPTRWWLALNGRPDGPRTIAYVTAGLQSGQLSLTTPVCPEGSSEWRPLGTWPELASLAHVSTSLPPAPPPRTTIGSAHVVGTDHLLTNPALPPMANLICVYTILITPLYWIIGFLELFTIDNPFLESTLHYWLFALEEVGALLVTLGLAIFLAVGGTRLRDLRASGERMIRLGLGLSLIVVALRLMFMLAMFVLGAMAGTFEDSTDPMSAWGYVIIFLGVVLFAFDIVSLVWLVRNRARLPLQSHL